MGITFTAAQESTTGYVISCGCEGVTTNAPRFGNYNDAHDALNAIPFGTEQCAAVHREPLPGCEMPEICPDYRLWVYPVEAPEHRAPAVDIGHGNITSVLRALGLDQADDLGGELAGADLLGRVLLALALDSVESGVPAWTEGTRWTDCGRTPGYLRNKLGQLHQLAEWCVAQGAAATWA